MAGQDTYKIYTMYMYTVKLTTPSQLPEKSFKLGSDNEKRIQNY